MDWKYRLAHGSIPLPTEGTIHLVDYVEERNELVAWLRRQLMGPAGESMQGSPLDRYPTGVLHPIDPGRSGIDPALAGTGQAKGALLDDQDDTAPLDGVPDDQPVARPARRRRYVPPSSVGLSFFVRGNARLSIVPSAAVYQDRNPERGEQGRFLSPLYVRSELPECVVTWSGSGAPSYETSDRLWEGCASIDTRARPYRDGVIATVTLSNRGELDPNAFGRHRTRDRVEKSLFEARLECVIESGELVDYPRVDRSLLTEEEQELELQYRQQRIYAIGHGAAADWELEPGQPARIWSDFMPQSKVPLIAVETLGEEGVLSLDRLGKEPIPDELERFVDRYAGWVAKQNRNASAFRDRTEQDTANRICGRMGIAVDRMRGCIEMLRTEALSQEAFRLANQAMLDQMHQADRVAGRDRGPHRWRPFQLAFLLTTMESVIREQDAFREVVDLIWFPTGGGKTEAYLGLIAFLIVWRRLQHPSSGAGTAAFMRYTLRLLTRQQFERAARMVCALELIRRGNAARYGEAPINIGIWVGREISPNTFVQARELVDEIRNGRPDARYKLLLERCPWCGTSFNVESGYHASEDDFGFRCVDPECAFGIDSRPLPCNVVDEALYRLPPSLLIGTIDKFARLAWEQRAGAFFGVSSGSRPPELVIQDELHLVTGPLGSVAGLYETGLETLLVQRGVRPKYVASTATIRMAEQQVRRLYARKLAVFPPPGLSHDDSYFARTDRERPGRLYVGYLSPMLDQQRCLAPLAAALLAAPWAVFDGRPDRDALLDAWWTQVIYHGSLKGVGNSHNAFMTDVRDFGRWLTGGGEEQRDYEYDADVSHRGHGLEGTAGRLQHVRVAQLTSRRPAEENAETFERLKRSRETDGCLDAVLATNMVSVGVDVARLALMIVNGQPLTTAEYIQATSRVGRGDVPGLVLANYYRHQARSLSHYESFRPYHESFYRFVEPSSVTPFTHQVRSRALHAALVIAVRHTCADLRGNASAGNFDRTAPEVRAVLAHLKKRCGHAAADSGQRSDTECHLERLVEQWHDEARRCEQDRRQLRYQAPDSERNADRLLYAHGDARPGLWATLHSMRNVEGTGALRVHEWPREKAANGNGRD